ncbi:hypothetical protein CUN91_00500 [Candidatus Carsonella ruddii]|uniref:Uncharacterized protein n=1 Tax=Carsonella ruddii TaxID=114186 RepID=A0A2K8K4A2_CARRU|nr:hypothetical protein [Candidatus Carsonella ruddii]ATX33435.1 hypothetical protein CUN91_00500 [Candidatus Carsonella ruddii]
MNIFFFKNINKKLSKRIFFLFFISLILFKKNIKKNIKKKNKKIIFNNKIEKYLIKIVVKKYE